MFPQGFFCAGHVAHCGRQWWSQGVDRVDLSPRDHWFTTCAKSSLSDSDRRLTCRHMVANGASDPHRMQDRERLCDLHRTAEISWRDHDSIATRSWSDQYTIMATITSNWWTTIIVQWWPSNPPPHQIKRSKIHAEISLLKTYVLSCFLWTLDWFVK